MKKKILSTVLSFTMVAGILAGCGSNGTTETTTSNDTAASTEETSEAAAEEKTEETAEATTEESTEETTDSAASGDKVTLSIYTQYADDDTKVPYDYAVEQLKEAYYRT